MKTVVAGILGGVGGAALATVAVFLIGMWTDALNFHSAAPQWLRMSVLLLGVFGIPIAGVVSGFTFARRARKRERGADA